MKKRRLRMDRIAKAVTAAGAVAVIISAGVALKGNMDWYSARKDVVPTQVHITNFEESFDTVNDEDSISVMQLYHLVGTYDNNSGEKSVIVLNEAYPDKSFANTQIGGKRDIYLAKSTFGAAGVQEVSVPDFNNDFVPFVVGGTAVSILGAALLIGSKKKRTASVRSHA